MCNDGVLLFPVIMTRDYFGHNRDYHNSFIRNTSLAENLKDYAVNLSIKKSEAKAAFDGYGHVLNKRKGNLSKKNIPVGIT